MHCEIISIGDELLIGQVVNTNAAWLGARLNEIGMSVVRSVSIGDDRQIILQSLAEASCRAGLVLITGGLGPTKDDITKDVLCEYFSTPLVFDEEVFATIDKFFGSRGLGVSELNRAQAELPESCTPIHNSNGTAPGMWFEKDDVIYVSMPGVPYEMKHIMESYVLPELRLRNGGEIILHKTILTQGMGESFIAARVSDWEEALPAHIRLAYLPQPGIVRMRLTARGNDAAFLQKSIDNEVRKLRLNIPELIFGFDDERLEEIIGKLLSASAGTLATAESCTGGYLAHMITSIPGSSAYFKGSVVAYSNEIKTSILGVKDKTLLNYGAVSRNTVIEMAEGVKSLFNTDFAIATSGIAGPDGGTGDKPVGTAWIAVSGPGITYARHYMFGDHRNRNIHKTAVSALNMLRKLIIGEELDKNDK